MSRLARMSLLVLCLAGAMSAQSTPAPQTGGPPEEAFVSRSKYTNAFFGFTLLLPQDTSLHDLSLPSGNPSRHFLFGLTSHDHGVTALTVTAASSESASADARKAASGSKGQNAKRVEIGGKEFWKSESQEKESGGKMWTVKYSAALMGYILEFDIVSFDGKLTSELERCIESVTFFNPEKAREIAGADSQPYKPVGLSRSSLAAIPHPSGRIKGLSEGTVSGNSYVNAALGLSYEFPVGWYVADKATQDKVIEAGHQAAWGNSPDAAREHETVQNCMRALLWTTKYPEGTPTKEVNPLIVLSVADPDCFPAIRFPTSSDDQETISQVGQALVRSFQGAPLFGQGNIRLGTLTAQGHFFLVVSGESKMNLPGRSAPVEAHNSMVITSANNFWLVWIFSSGSEAELQELKNTNIRFSSSPAAP